MQGSGSSSGGHRQQRLGVEHGEGRGHPARRGVAVLCHQLAAVEDDERVVGTLDRQPVRRQHLQTRAEPMGPAAEHHVQVAVAVGGDAAGPVPAARQPRRGATVPSVSGSSLSTHPSTGWPAGRRRECHAATRRARPARGGSAGRSRMHRAPRRGRAFPPARSPDPSAPRPSPSAAARRPRRSTAAASSRRSQPPGRPKASSIAATISGPRSSWRKWAAPVICTCSPTPGISSVNCSPARGTGRPGPGRRRRPGSASPSCAAPREPRPSRRRRGRSR